MKAAAKIIQRLAPNGALRASINLGNPLLAYRNLLTGQVGGISVDLAQAFADRLGVDLELVVFDTAGKSVDAVTGGRADIGFFAIDPARGETISFTEPYLLIEGCYLVPNQSPLQSNEEVDQPGNRVAVGKGSAYDLFLTRELRQAEIVRSETSQTVVDLFVARKLEVAACIKQQLEADARRFPGHRLLPGRFMLIRQAMGLQRERGEAAAKYLCDFVLEMKAGSFVREALARHEVEGASPA